jgi:hypothetical protein
MVIGYLWYGPVLGKTWAAEMGLPADFKPDSKVMTRAVILQLVGAFLTAYVLAHSVQVWRPSVWMVGGDGSDAMYGFMAGFFTWIGFYVPQLLASIAWENKSWKLFFINAGYYFIGLQVVGMILAYWR